MIDFFQKQCYYEDRKITKKVIFSIYGMIVIQNCKAQTVNCRAAAYLNKLMHWTLAGSRR